MHVEKRYIFININTSTWRYSDSISPSVKIINVVQVRKYLGFLY